MSESCRVPASRGALLSLCLTLLATIAPAADQILMIDAEELAAELERRQGRVVLVNFWATWCRPCLEEIGDLLMLEEQLSGQGFELLAVSLDEPESAETIVQPFLERWFPGLTSYLSVERDMDRIVSVIDPAWNEVLPTSYVIASDGSVAMRIQGGASAEEFGKAIRPLL